MRRRIITAVILLIVVIVLFVLLIWGISATIKASRANAASVPGTTGVVSLDGNTISMFEDQAKAESNKTTADAGTHTLKVSGRSNVSIRATASGNSANGIVAGSGNDYELDLNGLSDGTIVILTVAVGGDGSFLSERLSEEVKRYYVALEVNNPDVSANTASTLGVPSGKVYFGEASYLTYRSEEEAQKAVEDAPLVLPTYMVADGIPVRAEPGENTYRIQVTICMLDGESFHLGGPFLWSENNWEGTLDVSACAGHQVTLMLHAENDMGFVNGYTYVSFYVPAFD